MIALIAAGVVCLVLARAVAHKLAARFEFQSAVADYGLLPGSWVAPISAGLIIAELAAIGALLLPPWRQTGAVFASLLFAVYAGAIAINLLRGRSRIDCGCGGPAQQLSWWLVSRNAVLIGACALAGARAEPVSSLSKAFAASGCAIALWLSALVFEQLLANRHHARDTSYSGNY